MPDLNDETADLFAEFGRHLLAGNRSPKTVRNYRVAVADLDAFLSSTVTSCTTSDIRAWSTERLTHLSPTTVAIMYRALRSFFNWLVREGELPASPMAGTQEPKQNPTPPDVLPDEALSLLLKTCSGVEFHDRRDTAMIRLWCEPGSPRLGEMTGIQLAHVDKENSAILVEGKTGARWVPLSPKTAQAVDRYLRARKKHPRAARPELWLGTKGPLVPSGVAQMLRRRSSQAGLKRVYPHMLRHTAASAWLGSGGSEGDAQVLFGWSENSTMPRRYGRSAATVRAMAAAKARKLADRV